MEHNWWNEYSNLPHPSKAYKIIILKGLTNIIPTTQMRNTKLKPIDPR